MKSVTKSQITLATNAQLEEWAYDPTVSSESRKLILEEIQYRFDHNPYIGNFGGLVAID